MILALDATAEQCSAALLLKDGHILSRAQHAPRDHTQMLLAFVDGLLAEGQVSLASLDAIAFGAGPGSFTGLRIAAAITQGLAYGAQKPVIPISSLRAVAYEVHAQHGAKSVMVAIDARKNEVYWGLYKWDKAQGMILEGEERVLPASDAPLPKGLSHWVAAGSGFHAYKEAFAAHTQLRESACYSEIVSHSHAIASLAAYDLAAGKTVMAENAIPYYVRNDVIG